MLHLVSQPYTPKSAATISTRLGKLKVSVYPHKIAPNVWILTAAPSTVTMEITLICPGEPTIFFTVEKPIHVLQLPPGCYIPTLLSTSTI